MNKKGDINLSDPKNLWAIPIILFIIFVLYLALTPLIDINCSSKNSQITTLTNERDAWINYANSLNDSINNCSNLIQNQINICDKRINQSVNDCKTNLEISVNYIIANKIFFAVYHILVIFLYIPLTINLIKIVFKVKLRKKWEELITFWQKTLLIVKIIFWVILTLVFIGYILAFLFSNPV